MPPGRSAARRDRDRKILKAPDTQIDQSRFQRASKAHRFTGDQRGTMRTRLSIVGMSLCVSTFAACAIDRSSADKGEPEQTAQAADTLPGDWTEDTDTSDVAL